MKVKKLRLIALVIFILVEAGLIFVLCKDLASSREAPMIPAPSSAERRPPSRGARAESIPAVPLAGIVEVSSSSAPIFAYAHGTVQADGQFFVGMANRAGNPFPSNEIVIFSDPADLSRYALVTLPKQGDVETMVYDALHDQIYFDLSSDGSLDLFRLDPRTYQVSNIISTSSIDTGRRPAIVTDGAYIYGITETEPSTVFKVSLADGSLSTRSLGYISSGHSAAIGVYGSTTELYFGTGASNFVVKMRAEDLSILSTINVFPCLVSDDMPFRRDEAGGGYIYLGCEMIPYGKAIHTPDMSVSQFPLPGYSYGMFVNDGALYNAAQDAAVDVFPGFDLNKGRRYGIMMEGERMKMNGQDVSPNELFFSTTTDSLYFTGWWGQRGLYQVPGLSRMR